MRLGVRPGVRLVCVFLLLFYLLILILFNELI